MKRSILKTVVLSIGLLMLSALFSTTIALSSPLLAGTGAIAQTPSAVPSPELIPPTATNPAPTPAPNVPEDAASPSASEPDQAVRPAKQPEPPSSPRLRVDRKTETGGPYDMETIKAFNRALYGS